MGAPPLPGAPTLRAAPWRAGRRAALGRTHERRSRRASSTAAPGDGTRGYVGWGCVDVATAEEGGGEEGAGQEGRREEDAGQDGAGQEGRREEDAGQEGGGHTARSPSPDPDGTGPAARSHAGGAPPAEEVRHQFGAVPRPADRRDPGGERVHGRTWATDPGRGHGRCGPEDATRLDRAGPGRAARPGHAPPAADPRDRVPAALRGGVRHARAPHARRRAVVHRGRAVARLRTSPALRPRHGLRIVSGIAATQVIDAWHPDRNGLDRWVANLGGATLPVLATGGTRAVGGGPAGAS